MVNGKQSNVFRSEEDGVALTEGLMVFPMMVLAIAALVEFGYLLHQWNMGAKAMHLGVRKLVVSPPVTPDFNSVFAFDPSLGGQLINANAGVSSSCGAGTGVACDANAMSRLVNGTGGTPWPGMATYFPGLQASDIRITYQLSGLGYQGRPAGPVVTVRMELQRQSTNLPVTGALLRFAGVSFPPFAVSATSEDLQNGPS